MEEYLFVLKKAFVGDIYNENYESLSDGGPRCYSEMTTFFKTMITACSVILFYINIIKNIYKITYHLSLMIYSIKKTVVPKTNLCVKPNFFEKIIGFLSLLIFICQFYYRINEQRGIYMINPCHWCLV